MTSSEKIAIIYHEIFGYTLSRTELKKWTAGPKLTLQSNRQFLDKKRKNTNIAHKIDKVNRDKMKIALASSKVLQRIPFISFVGITGSLAMNNAKPKSDIDLMVITKRNMLWITRLITMLILFLSGFRLRRAGNNDEEDKLCLNYWIDESSLRWEGPKNAYIAHEIAQVVPLVNKINIYEDWISQNIWIKDYWPNAVVLPRRNKGRLKVPNISFLLIPLNIFFFLIQKAYMSTKITRETVTPTEAHFHPYDWGQKVLAILKQKGVIEV